MTREERLELLNKKVENIVVKEVRGLGRDIWNELVDARLGCARIEDLNILWQALELSPSGPANQEIQLALSLCFKE